MKKKPFMSETVRQCNKHVNNNQHKAGKTSLFSFKKFTSVLIFFIKAKISFFLV